MIQYYAHINRKTGEKETVKEHTEKTMRLAREFGEQFDAEDETEFIASIHDLGKLTDRFARVLQHKETRINHACVGAAVMFRLSRDIFDDEHLMVYFNLPKNHHTGFVDADDNCFDPDLIEETEILVDDILDNPEAIICDKTTAVSCREEYDHIVDAVKEILGKYAPQKVKNLQDMCVEEKMLYIRLLFSCLVDADYSATASFMGTNDYLDKMDGPSLEPEKLLLNLEDYRNHLIQSASESPINTLRNYVYDCAGNAGQKHEPRFFTMTAPTGTAKTLAMIKFALESAKRNNQRRIFIVLPYLSITTQTVKTYREIFGDNIVFEDDSTTKIDGKTEEEKERLKIYANRWSAPIIVTTNVKFYETLFSHLPTSLRKLHNITNSVIVFDESQTLSPQYADITINTLSALPHFKTSVVLSTATPPQYDMRQGIVYQPTEIITNVRWLYREYSHIRKNKITFSKKKWTAEMLSDYYKNKQQALYVVNTKRKAALLFNQMCRERPREDCFMLSSDMCPGDKSDTIDCIKDRLKNDLPCVVVSTQCVEAGVDFDFPCGAREYAPWSSLIQAVGRVNRNALTTGRVLVFDWDKDLIDGYPSQEYRTEATISWHIAEHHRWKINLNNLSALREYYEQIFAGDGIESHDRKEIREAVEFMMFEKLSENYKVIEKSDTINVIVPYSKRMNLYEEITKQIYSNEYLITGKEMRKAHEIAVSTYDTTNKIKSACIQLSIRCGEAIVPTNWYILPEKDLYEDGIGIQVNTGGIFQ